MTLKDYYSYFDHDCTKNRLYRIWLKMKQRCYNPNHHNYNRYGGRGITVCEEWKEHYNAFCSWALSHGYQEELSIDRIDNDGNYCPENCRWATASQQNSNKAPYHNFTIRKPVAALDQHGKVLMAFSGICSAAKGFSLGKKSTENNIRNAVKNPGATAYGYHWRYLDESDFESGEST